MYAAAINRAHLIAPANWVIRQPSVDMWPRAKKALRDKISVDPVEVWSLNTCEDLGLCPPKRRLA